MLNVPIPENGRYSIISRHKNTQGMGLITSLNPWMPPQGPLPQRLFYKNVLRGPFEGIADRKLLATAPLSPMLSDLPGAISNQDGYARLLQLDSTQASDLNQITTRVPFLPNKSSKIGQLPHVADFVDDVGGKGLLPILPSSRNHLAAVEPQAQEAGNTMIASDAKDEFQVHGHPQDTSNTKEHGLPRRSRMIRARTFAMKLMDSIINKKNDDAVTWLPRGKSFLIVDRDRFMKEIHPYSFKHCKYESFIRKLNQWGFIRVASVSGADCFTHELFQRDRIDLILEMRCHDWRIRRS